MIIGAHSILYSKDSEADRAFLLDILGLPSVDVGEGWLIFGLPPAEVAVHPSDENDVHEFFLMCEDADRFVARMRELGVACEAVRDMGWGRLTQVRLPGGGQLGVYEPRHARPEPMRPSSAKKAAKARSARKKAAKRGAGKKEGKGSTTKGTKDTKAVKKKGARKPARRGRR